MTFIEYFGCLVKKGPFWLYRSCQRESLHISKVINWCLVLNGIFVPSKQMENKNQRCYKRAQRGPARKPNVQISRMLNLSCRTQTLRYGRISNKALYCRDCADWPVSRCVCGQLKMVWGSSFWPYTCCGHLDTRNIAIVGEIQTCCPSRDDIPSSVFWKDCLCLGSLFYRRVPFMMASLSVSPDENNAAWRRRSVCCDAFACGPHAGTRAGDVGSGMWFALRATFFLKFFF